MALLHSKTEKENANWLIENKPSLEHEGQVKFQDFRTSLPLKYVHPYST